MFEKLRIQNFQSHKDTLFEFVPGINVIVGTSDSGKSAIFRALKWLMYNRPTGDAFCSYWSNKSARVELTLDDCKIVRAREKNKQIYELNDLSFTAFKTEVPEEIVKALNMEDVNFQQQFDRPFLLDISSGEVAQYFNKIAHLESIDKVLKSLHQTERTVKQNLVWYTDEKTKVEIELEQYVDLEKIDQKLSVLEKGQELILNIENEVEDLISKISQIRQFQEKLLAQPALLFIIDSIDEVILLSSEVKTFFTIMEQSKQVKQQISMFDGLVECENLLTDILGSSQGIKELETEIKQITLDVQTVKTLKDTINSINSNIEAFTVRFKKEMPAICPLCGNSTI